MRRKTLSRTQMLLLAGLFGVSMGVACKSGGSSGQVQSVSGSSSCPRAVPRSGSSCPRGAVDFCVYRTTGGDHVCTCGKSWTCARK